MAELLDSPPNQKELLNPSKQRAAKVLGIIVFGSLLVLIVITAIPYGTAEAWWKAFFVCVVFALAIIWLLEGWLSASWISDGWVIVLPIVALALLSFVQTISFRSQSALPGEITLPPWNAISVDPYQTQFFLAQLLALTFTALFLLRYASSEGRLRTLMNVVIGAAVASALFGILRQTAQHAMGFALPLLPVDSGYGQFINRNHFAFLMEMGFGLTTGMIVGSGGKREHALIYSTVLLPIWTGLALCGSRGGLIAMLAQVITAALLFGVVVQVYQPIQSQSRAVRILKSWPTRLLLLLLLICSVGFGTLWVGGDRLATRIEDSQREFASPSDDLREGTSRSEIWRMSLRMFVAHPLLGVGMGAYSVAVPTFHDASGTTTPQEAHNDYLELLASGGIIGFVIMAWFALVVFRRARQNLRAPDSFRRAACFGATVGIVGVLVHSLVDYGLHMIVNALVFTTLITIATSNARWASPKSYD